MILIYMMVLCTQVNKMYVIATLSVYPHRASLKNMPGHGGIRTYDLWNASPMLCQLSYAVRSVRGIFFKLARCGYTLRVAITYKYYFALKQLKTREFWKNANVFGFKTAENC